MLRHPLALVALAGALPLAAPSCEPGEPPGAPPAADRQDPISPRVRLRISGQLEGRLEPCGCASGQIGGLARRSFRLKQDRGYDVLIEGGNLVPDGSPLDELKLYTILNVLYDGAARYDAVCVGPRDLRLDRELLAGYLEAFPEIAFLCADLVADGERPWPVRPYFETAVGDLRVRVVALTMTPPADALTGDRPFRLLSPADAWTEALTDCPPTTLRVLVGHGSNDAVRGLASLDPKPDLLVAINESEPEPRHEPEDASGVPLVHPGTRGRFLLDVTLTRGPKGPRLLRYEPVPLQGSRTAKGAMQDAAVRELILSHRHMVKEAGTREQMANRYPSENGIRYTGNTSCISCHRSAWKVWQESKHGHAWRTLADAESTGRYEWPVTHYPDCVQCHTVGYGQESGFVGPDATPQLRDVGCEQCHGPGGAHVAAGGKEPMPAQSPEQWIARCTQCHDYEQSPDFDYDERWAKIAHGLDEGR